MITVPVDLAERSYNVIVGAGARHRLAAMLPEGARRVVIVTQEGIETDVDPGVAQSVARARPAGEDAKTLATGRDALPRVRSTPG